MILLHMLQAVSWSVEPGCTVKLCVCAVAHNRSHVPLNGTYRKETIGQVLTQECSISAERPNPLAALPATAMLQERSIANLGK